MDDKRKNINAASDGLFASTVDQRNFIKGKGAYEN